MATMDSNEQVNGSAALFAKMARIMGKVKRLKKTGHNNFFNYDFATDSDIADTIRELLAEENIAVFAQLITVDQVTYMSDKNKTTWRTRGNFMFTLACGDTGATFSCSWIGEADDTGDKGINKAATAAEKYWLLKTFVMSTGDERDDADNDSHLGKQPAKQPASNGKPATPNGNVSKAFPDIAAKDAFVTHWQSTDNLTEDYLKQALGVKYFNEYTGTLAQANKAVEDYKLSKVPFGAKP
jgi:hypothetical protein